MALIIQVICYKKGHGDQAHYKGNACTWVEDECGGVEWASKALLAPLALLELSLGVPHRKVAGVKR